MEQSQKQSFSSTSAKQVRQQAVQLDPQLSPIQHSQQNLLGGAGVVVNDRLEAIETLGE